MSIDTIIIVSITAGIHIVGFGVFLLWMAAGSPMSIAEFSDWLKKRFLAPSEGDIVIVGR